ncbi:MAG: proline--tRNA ligase [Anaerolineaceae bacterium]|nr:proline--tRNA ligase [Anaerolineaceae bacterium]
MSEQRLTPQAEDFARWYNEVVYRAELASQSPVRGCIIIRPYGFELWEAIKNSLDQKFKATGHQNAYFPLFIPQSYIQRESEHIEGFSPELAVVTHGGGKELEEPYVVRPTSETIIGEAFANWIQSYRDLPLLINQWSNVVRWELRPRAFLRTSEFLWQEGHTAHATREEAEAETRQMLQIYEDLAQEDAAIPVFSGLKSEKERFAGAVHTYTIEAMMRDGRALQSGTSHNLGQNFARAFDMKYLTPENKQEFCWTTSWGMSTRMVGAIIMAHGDDQGLRLPPRLAPIQVVLIPIHRNEEQRSQVMEKLQAISQGLSERGIRPHLDDREGLTPGYKFNDWELRGVPLRIELGPRDLAGGNVTLSRRDVSGEAGKQIVAIEACQSTAVELLAQIQHNLFAEAKQFQDDHVHDVKNYDELWQVIEGNAGWARAWWAGSGADELRIQQETSATIRCFPMEQPESAEPCFFTGTTPAQIALFAKAY